MAKLILSLALLGAMMGSVSPQTPGNPPCNPCGEEGATMSNPNAIIVFSDEDIQQFGNNLEDIQQFAPFATCGLIYTLMLDGFLEEEYCAIMEQYQTVVDGRVTCGCSNIVRAPTPTIFDLIWELLLSLYALLTGGSE